MYDLQEVIISIKRTVFFRLLFPFTGVKKLERAWKRK